MTNEKRVMVLIVSLLSAVAYSADFNVRDFGAKGNGAAKDTAAIQSAIDTATAKGGGRVVFVDGTFLSGALRLKSGVELHIDRTATLLASPDIADFPDWPDAKHVVKENLPRTRNAAFVFADEAERIAITGDGTIDCNGSHHIKEKADGDWKGWNSANHPLGREGTARRYAGIGWIMGSWAGPFMLSSGLKEMNEEFSDSIYRRADGAPWVFKNAWAHGDAGKLPPEKRPAIYALDPSCPKVIDKLRDDFSYLREQGVRYYMLDFLQTGLAYGGAGPDAPRFSGKDGSRSRVEAFYKAMTAIREAAGPETYLLGCSGPTFCCVGTVDGVRTAGDLGEGRAITRPGTFFYPASYGINRLNFWTGPERALYNTASYYTHGRLFNNDLGNVLTVGEPMPVEHARINAAIHAFAGSSSMFGDDPRDISTERLALVTATFPRESGPAVPEDLFTGELGSPPSVLRYDFPDASVCAVVNLGKEPIRRTLRRKGVFVLFDYFDARMRNRHRDEAVVTVPPESVRVYRLNDFARTPQLIGSSTAFTGRDAKASWDDRTSTLSVAVKRPRRERGIVYLFAPPGWHLANAAQGRIGKDADTGELVVAVPFETDEEGNWSTDIRFGRHPASDVEARNEAERFG